jgi:hypothetical protein
VVFDGTPEQLTESEAQRLYGLESEPRNSVAPAAAGVVVEDPVLGIPAIA